MSMYKNLMTVCCAAALALGLAACGGGGGSDGPTASAPSGSTAAPPAPPPTSACDAGPSQACVAEKKTALDAAKTALAALRADDDATQGEIKAAEMAVTDAMEAYEMAQSDLTAYNAMQPPMYDLKAMTAAITSPATLGGGISVRNTDATTDTVRGGKVTVNNTATPPANTYSEATWPVPTISGWMGSVWERSTPTEDSVVVYTNVEDAKGAEWNTYYAATLSAAPTDPPAGRSYKAWDGVTSAAAGQTDGSDDANKPTVLTLAGTVGTAHMLYSAEMLPTGNGITKTYEDGDEDTTGIQVKFAGSFNGVMGMFMCTDGTACSAANNAKGALATLTGTWTFTADSKDAMVSGVLLDADYLDFGYWVQTDDSGESVEYMANTFFRGEDPSGDLASLEGSAMYKGGAAGLYSKRAFAPGGDGDVTAVGRFTADAELTAYFGGGSVAANDQNSISGTIKNFMDGGHLIDAAWLVELNKIKSGETGQTWADGAFSGGTTTGGGTWSGAFYGTVDATSTPHTLPSGVAGQFTAGFNNGDVIGSFGATKTKK